MIFCVCGKATVKHVHLQCENAHRKKNNEAMVVEMSLRFLYFKYIILINYDVEVECPFKYVLDTYVFVG